MGRMAALGRQQTLVGYGDEAEVLRRRTGRKALAAPSVSVGIGAKGCVIKHIDNGYRNAFVMRVFDFIG